MRSTTVLLLAALTLTATTSAPAWAGTTGNGWARSNSTSFAFCYGGNPYTEYYSRVFPLATTTWSHEAQANEGVAFTHYLDGIGDRTNGAQCITAPTMAGAAAEKQNRQSAAAEYHHRKVVEIDWAGS
ncbi:MAG TPA: hypothetical protein VN693_08305 [Rhodanobacteraceae bacterium]|nr:hypothetical protein [Rhodanobacteraceae bacterium]